MTAQQLADKIDDYNHTIYAIIGFLNFYLYDVIPKGFFPQQDTGRIIGIIQADQSISFQLMQQKLTQFVSILKKDPAVETAVGFTGVIGVMDFAGGGSEVFPQAATIAIARTTNVSLRKLIAY